MSSSNIKKMFKQKHLTQANSKIKVLTLQNGATYRGQIQNQKPEGRGNLVYINGQRYQGQFHNGMKHGKGKYYYIKGELYIGDWFQNKKHGVGQYFYQNGTRYTGEFQNNMKHGHGRIDQQDGSYYEGHFYMNNKDKVGQYYDATRNKKFMLVFQNGKKITERQIIDIDIKDKDEKPGDVKFLQIFKNNDKNNINNIVSQGNIIVDDNQVQSPHNFTSQYQMMPHMLSLKNYQVKKQDDQKKLIAQNYFDKDLLDIKINQWTNKQVSSWLNQIGFGDCIQDFRENNIQGDSLLCLKNQDLKELGVSALGDRRILQRQIQFLKLVFKSQCLGDSISKFYKLRNRALSLQVVRQLQIKRQKKQILKQNLLQDQGAYSSSSSSSTDSEGSIEQRKKKEKKQKKKNTSPQNMQSKIEAYMAKKGIKLTFLIPKEQIQIIQPIGKGGYGQVFLGRWLGQEVAVKKYLKKQGFRNKHVGHFIEQVQVINKLLHPSIVLYMGMCIYDNQYGMVTEFLSGGSLFDYLHKKKQKLTQQKIIYIMKDVALGMSYLHGKNVLHCDLKSSNVLIDQNWNVKLCDFGLSRVNSTKKKKQKNIRVGTPHWMAPQILKGQKYECYSDVYSFGILVWQMLTGKIPYKDLSTAQIIGLVANNQNHHIAIPNYHNQYVLRIFLSCTERDPLKRPSFKAIIAQLEIAQSKLPS